jgi:hypothetical protein
MSPKQEIIEWLNIQASIYSRAATLANRKKVKAEATVKSDCVRGLILALENSKIGNS